MAARSGAGLLADDEDAVSSPLGKCNPVCEFPMKNHLVEDWAVSADEPRLGYRGDPVPRTAGIGRALVAQWRLFHQVGRAVDSKLHGFRCMTVDEEEAPTEGCTVLYA